MESTEKSFIDFILEIKFLERKENTRQVKQIHEINHKLTLYLDEETCYVLNCLNCHYDHCGQIF